MSLRLQADVDLKYAIVKAVRQREPGIDFASAAESRLERVTDPELLDRAARAGRILVSHDRRTMIDHFRARLEACLAVSWNIHRDYRGVLRYTAPVDATAS